MSVRYELESVAHVYELLRASKPRAVLLTRLSNSCVHVVCRKKLGASTACATKDHTANRSV